MIQSYKKILEIESFIVLKMEEDKKRLSKLRKALHQEKQLVTTVLIKYLKHELNQEYFKYRVMDIDNNIADILVNKNSNIFKKYIAEKDFVTFNLESLIDNRMFKNEDEIIITDMNFDDKQINLGYLCDSLNYNNLSYSETLKDKLSVFLDFAIKRSIKNNIK